MQFSDELIENWSPSSTINSSKTWRQTLHSTLSSTKSSSIDPKKQKEALFLQDFLNAILPPMPTKVITKQIEETEPEQKQEEKEDPRGPEEQEKLCYSLVSTKQATRKQLNEMKEKLEELISYRRARKNGLDPIRYQLAFQLFDEMIREVTIDCKERGLLLLRIRDEAMMTLQSYGILKQVASTFSINEATKSDQGFEELIQTKNELLAKKQKLESELLKLENTMRDKQKEVEVLAEVQTEQLEQHKAALEDEANNLRLLIDAKQRKSSGLRSRRKSVKLYSGKSTRRETMRHPNLSQFSFASGGPASP